MKTTGWIFLVIGILSLISTIVNGNIAGSLFWIVLGAYLIHRAKQKEQEKKDKDAWDNDNNQSK